MEEQKELKDIYPARFFARRNSLAWRVPIVVGGIMQAFGLKKGDSLIDCGCATGDFIQGFRDQGINAVGIEGSTAALPYLVCDKKHVSFMDLAAPIETHVTKTLAMSLEVIEHLFEADSDQFIENLTGMSDTVLITAAPPGAKGVHHVNCQPASYWIAKFNNFNYVYSGTLTSRLKREWEAYKRKKGINSYFANCLVFTKG